MGTITQNVESWGDASTWAQAGDEWSRGWGGPGPQWFGMLLPRIAEFIACGTILEIAPGMGRWPQFLKDHCREFIGVDLNENCTQACKARFAENPRMTFHTNDGLTLPMVKDGSVDFVFSFDSLVHVDPTVMKSYLAEIRRVLTPNGVAFLHHSNCAEVRMQPSARVLNAFEYYTGIERFSPNRWWRDWGVSAALVEQWSRGVGLSCRGQEIINWKGRFLTDCISVITPERSRWARANVVVRNPRFRAQALEIAERARVYG